MRICSYQRERNASRNNQLKYMEYIIEKVKNGKTENYLGHIKGMHRWGQGAADIFTEDDLLDGEAIVTAQAKTMFSHDTNLILKSTCGKVILSKQGAVE